jgi:hypothetical protein
MARNASLVSTVGGRCKNPLEEQALVASKWQNLSNPHFRHLRVTQLKGINRKQSTRWQYLSRLKTSAFFSLQIFFSYYETQQLILGTDTAIWWLTEPHWLV